MYIQPTNIDPPYSLVNWRIYVVVHLWVNQCIVGLDEFPKFVSTPYSLPAPTGAPVRQKKSFALNCHHRPCFPTTCHADSSLSAAAARTRHQWCPMSDRPARHHPPPPLPITRPWAADHPLRHRRGPPCASALWVGAAPGCLHPPLAPCSGPPLPLARAGCQRCPAHPSHRPSLPAFAAHPHRPEGLFCLWVKFAWIWVQFDFVTFSLSEIWLCYIEFD
jgi:hypothetical protein